MDALGKKCTLLSIVQWLPFTLQINCNLLVWPLITAPASVCASPHLIPCYTTHDSRDFLFGEHPQLLLSLLSSHCHQQQQPFPSLRHLPLHHGALSAHLIPGHTCILLVLFPASLENQLPTPTCQDLTGSFTRTVGLNEGKGAPISVSLRVMCGMEGALPSTLPITKSPWDKQLGQMTKWCDESPTCFPT